MKRKRGDRRQRKPPSYLSAIDEGDNARVSRCTRDQRPLNYSLKIQSFSLLAKSKLERYESQQFLAAGYKWKLALYPNGDKKRNGSGHLSLYLVLAENDIPSTSEVYAVFTFLVYDNRRDKHLTIQDGKIRCFHAMTTEWGFSKLLSLRTFNDASNGFLVDDCCEFGVDVFVMKCEGNGERLSLIKQPKNNTYTCKINNFSKLDQTYYECGLFTVEGYDWKIGFYPKGKSEHKGVSFSLYLCLASNDAFERLEEPKVYIESEMVIRSQVSSSLHQKKAYDGWLDFGCAKAWGDSKFMSLGDLMDPSKGFILNDLLIITAKISVISTLKKFS